MQSKIITAKDGLKIRASYDLRHDTVYYSYIDSGDESTRYESLKITLGEYDPTLTARDKMRLAIVIDSKFHAWLGKINEK